MAEAKKQEKEGFFRRTANRFSKWFREMRAELKKVVWPTKKQVLNNTLIVLAVVLIAAVVICGLDVLFSFVIKLLIK